LVSRLRLPFFALLTLFICLCTHECGHAIAALLTGGHVTEVQLLSFRPHVQIAGNGSTAEEAFRTAAGSGFFLLTYVVFALLFPSRNGATRLVRDAAALFAIVEILGWVLSSLTPWAAMGPNDAEHFLAVSGTPRSVVAAVAASVGIAGTLALHAVGFVRDRAPTRPARPEPVRPLAKSAAGGV
jgi:hypothetical protein